MYLLNICWHIANEPETYLISHQIHFLFYYVIYVSLQIILKLKLVVVVIVVVVIQFWTSYF